MSTMVTPAQAEAEIRALMASRVAAVLAKDAAAVMAHHAPDAVFYDLIEPMRYEGRDAIRGRLKQWFDGYEGAMGYEIRDLAVFAAFDVAFSHGLHRVTGTLKGGQKIDMWWRATQGFQRVEGKWRLVHEHSSIPFDMETGKVSFDLKP